MQRLGQSRRPAAEESGDLFASPQGWALGLGLVLIITLAVHGEVRLGPLGHDNVLGIRPSSQSALATFALIVLIPLAVAVSPRADAGLVWRCCGFVAAALAAMVTLLHVTGLGLAADPWTGGPHAIQMAAPVALLLLTFGQGLLLCGATVGRIVVCFAGIVFLMTAVALAQSVPLVDSLFPALFSLTGTCLAVAALFGSLRAGPRGAPAAPPRPAPRGPGIDLLTGLLTRTAFDRLMQQHAARAETSAMLLIDIDRFRAANHVLGNKAADRLLVQIAHRLEVIAAPHAVGRTGGDEFAIYCAALLPETVHALAKQMVDAIATPFTLADGRHFYLTASVGVAHAATDGVRDLRDAADEAVFIAKNQGGNQAVSFMRALHEARVERIGLEQDLYRAFGASDELFLAYQPIISLRDYRVIAVEALARWQHPTAGLVPPSRFVSIAEAAGLFSGLGAKVRELAVIQVARWRDSGVTDLPVVNLNISPLELARSDVPGTLSELVDRYGLPRHAFCLEVTEGAFADEHASRALLAAREAGFQVAMDDFGVGYSSLAQLPKLPLTSLKLDRAFLQRAVESDDGVSLFATIVQLAHVLKLPVVAEGVETPAELAVASDCGCDSVQGFFFSRPLSPAQLEVCLRQSAAHPGQLRLAWPPPAPELA